MCVEEQTVNTIARRTFDLLERFTFTGPLALPELRPGETCGTYVDDWLQDHGEQEHLTLRRCQQLYKEFGNVPPKLRIFQRYPRQQQVQFKISAALIASAERAQANNVIVAQVERWAKGDMMFSRTPLNDHFLQFIWTEYGPDEGTFEEVCDVVRPLLNGQQVIDLGNGTVITVDQNSVQAHPRAREPDPMFDQWWPFDGEDNDFF